MALATFIVGGCQAFLSFGANDDRSTDAGAARMDAAVDAAANGDALDSAPTMDAAVRFCDGLDATFCADFDDDAGSIDLGWLLYEERGGAHVKRDTDRAVSPPSSLGATAPGDGGAANLTQSFPVKRSLVLEMDLAPRAIPSASEPSAPLDVRAPLPDGGSEQRFHFYLYAGQPARVQQWLGPGTSVDFSLLRSVPTDVWTHVRLEIDTASSRLRVALDGSPVLDEPAAFVVPAGIFVVELGLPYASREGPSKLNIDNFVVYAK